MNAIPSPAPDLTGARVLVTGAAGFIGAALAQRLLAAGAEVTGVDVLTDYYDLGLKQARLQRLGENAGFCFRQLDIAEPGALAAVWAEARPDYVMHLAAQAGVRYSLDNPRAYTSANVDGFLEVLEAARHHPVRHLIYASSSSVYGANTKVPFQERDAVEQPVSLYAATKRANELMAQTYAHLYRLPVTGLRFFTVYGPRQRPDLAIHSFTRSIDHGKPINQFGDGSTRRDYTYIDDIIQGMLACLSYEGQLCDVFNLGESQTTTLTELIQTIEKALGKKAIINQMPEQPGDVPLTYADISKARALLGYDPHTKIAEGIPKFVDWYRQTQTQSIA